jgi:hypothetical protein
MLSPRTALALLAPLGTAVCGFWLWLHSLPALPWAWQTQLSPSGFSALASPSEWLRVAQNLNAAAQTAALFLCPLAFGLARRGRWTKSGRAAAVAAAGVCALAIACWLNGGRMPLLGNTLSSRGLGVITLTAPESKAAGLWSSGALWRLIDAFCVLCSAQLALLLLGKEGDRERSDAAAALLWFGLPPYLTTLALIDILNRSLNYDRYLLGALPFLIAALLLRAERRPRAWASAAGCLLLAAVSAAGLRDYFSWNRARWEAGRYGVSLGLRPEQIENGFDWDGQYTMEPNMARLLALKPAREIGLWDWMEGNKVLMITSFSDKPPMESFKPIARFPYRSPLARPEGFVYLYGLKPAFTPRK